MFSKIKVKLFVCTLCILIVGCISYGIYTHKKSAIPDSISLDEAIDWIDSKIQNDEGHDLYVDDFSFFCTRDKQFAKFKDDLQSICLIDLESGKEHTILLRWGEILPFGLDYNCDSYETKENDVLFDSSVVSKAVLWEDVKKMLYNIDWDDLASDQEIIHFDYSRVTFADCNKKEFLSSDFPGVSLKFQWDFAENKMKKVKSKDDIRDKDNVMEIRRLKNAENDYHFIDKKYIFL